MRTVGLTENFYKNIQQDAGIFLTKGEVTGVSPNGDGLIVEADNTLLGEKVQVKADMVVLATAIVANPDSDKLNKLYKVSVDGDGFFQEAHAKLRPVDFATEGMFVAGLAHYPKPVEESVAQALAASARAATLLSKSEVSLDAIKAEPDLKYCDGCALCLDVCPLKSTGFNVSINR